MKTRIPVILNSDGSRIKLEPHEIHNALWAAKTMKERYGSHPQTPYLNALGYDAAITVLTTISKKFTTQRFYEIPFADYLPVRIGEGTWSDQITTFRSFAVADEFETGVINTAGQNARLASADAAVDALNLKIYPWGKSIGYSIFDLEYAAKFANWDLPAAKEKARKTNWDLGLQRVAFLGARGLNGSGGPCIGLLNQPGINVNTSVITQKISTMTPTQLQTLTATIVEAYHANARRTIYPDRFIIPVSDFNGLAATVSPDFPIKSMLQLLEETFKVVCMNDKFKILPVAYADATASTGLASPIYMLTRYDEESIVMHIPLDYTTTLANSLDNFYFQNAGYGQFTGVLALRPLESLYFTYT
jgi:hypothetical protein